MRVHGWGCAWVRAGVDEKVWQGLGRAWLGWDVDRRCSPGGSYADLTEEQ